MLKSPSTSGATAGWRPVEIIGLALLFVLFASLLNSFRIGVPGYFVFGDQAEYAGMIYSLLHGQGMGGFRQYGPLFPAMVAGLQALLPSYPAFQIGIHVNLLASMAALWPFYQLCRRLLGTGLLTWMCSLALILAPFWAFSIVTWADPIFFALFFFSLDAASRCSVLGKWRSYLLLGILLGMMFLAKPVGLFYVVAMLLALAVSMDDAPLCRASLVRMGAVLLGSALCILPWIYRNIAIEHTSALGYSYVGTLFKEMLETTGWAKILGLLLAALCFHIAYIICCATGAALVIPAVLPRLWRNLSSGERVMIAYLILSLAAVSTISAIHMFISPYLGYWVPNGRYLTQYGPALLLLVALFWKKKTATASIGWPIVPALLCCAGAAVVYFCSPLESMATFSIFNNPEIALYSLLFDGLDVAWRGHYDPNYWQRLVPVAVGLLVPVPFFFCSRRRFAIAVCTVLVTTVMALTTWHQSRLIRALALGQRPFNQLLDQSAAQRTQIDLCAKDGLYFDTPLRERNLTFIRQAWCPAAVTQYAGPEEACALQLFSRTELEPGPVSIQFVADKGRSIEHATTMPYDNPNFSISTVQCRAK